MYYRDKNLEASLKKIKTSPQFKLLKVGEEILIILIIPYLCLPRGQESTNDKHVQRWPHRIRPHNTLIQFILNAHQIINDQTFLCY